MKRIKLRTYFITIIGIIIVFICLVVAFFYIIKANYSTEVYTERKIVTTSNSYSLEKNLKKIELTKILKSFPAQNYLDSANTWDIKAIRNDLIMMDSVNPGNTRNNQEALSIALTTELQKRIENSYKSFNSDSLLMLIHWTERFNYYADIDDNNSTFYKVIYMYWMEYITNKLDEYYNEEPSIKYNYRFRYLVSRCHEKNYNPGFGCTNSEKVIIYIIDSKWSYLFNRFWYGTGVLFKMGCSLLIIVLLAPYIYLLIKKVRKEKSK